MTMESVYIGSRVGAWWLQKEISIAFPEIEQERGLIEFWLELVSYRLSMRTLVPLSPLFCAYLDFIIYIRISTLPLVSIKK